MAPISSKTAAGVLIGPGLRGGESRESGLGSQIPTRDSPAFVAFLLLVLVSLIQQVVDKVVDFIFRPVDLHVFFQRPRHVAARPLRLRPVPPVDRLAPRVGVPMVDQSLELSLVLLLLAALLRRLNLLLAALLLLVTLLLSPLPLDSLALLSGPATF